MNTTAKPPLLLLVHRIPFPPNKGDKIRSWHLLKHLSTGYQVHLGYFVDDQSDLQYVQSVNAACESSCSVVLHPIAGKIRSLAGLGHNRALSLDYYRHAQMRAWVSRCMAQHEIRHVMVFSSVMAQYVESCHEATRIIDFVDVDSDKWSQYAKSKWWPLSWLYQREAVKLLDYERKIAALFDYSLFVSAHEAALFQRLAPESAAKTGFFNNGVNTDYFSPDSHPASPFPAGQKVIVFTGAMDYWPNCDAVHWFAQQVLPLLRMQQPTAHFYIVGARPTRSVSTLGLQDGVTVTGTVPDVRPYLAHADVAVAPLRIARGIQNKVLEAMAMARTVVLTPQALEGIDALADQEVLLAETAQQFVSHICAVFNGTQPDLGRAARAKTLTRYSWDANLATLDRLWTSQERPQ